MLIFIRRHRLSCKGFFQTDEDLADLLSPRIEWDKMAANTEGASYCPGMKLGMVVIFTAS